MGLGFTVGLTAIGIVRELLGAGEVFGIRVMPQSYEPLTIFVLAPGAFFVLACLVALQNKVKANLEKKGKKFRYRQDAAKVALHVQAKESAEVISQKTNHIMKRRM